MANDNKIPQSGNPVEIAGSLWRDLVFLESAAPPNRCGNIRWKAADGELPKWIEELNQGTS
jgi:hypothetical protein